MPGSTLMEHVRRAKGPGVKQCSIAIGAQGKCAGKRASEYEDGGGGRQQRRRNSHRPRWEQSVQMRSPPTLVDLSLSSVCTMASKPLAASNTFWNGKWDEKSFQVRPQRRFTMPARLPSPPSVIWPLVCVGGEFSITFGA
jgi:hypothetical protein